jgi:uncharacterized membrane protein
MHNSTSRLEVFCDGVFAIAITLLIIEIKVPAHDTITSTHTLFQALLEHWPSWFSFLLSFGTIFISWTNHHNAFGLIHKTTTLFNFANGFFLLTIAVLPYPTALLAEYITTDSARTAIMFYCSIIMLQNISWTPLFQYIIKPKDLSKNRAAKKMILKISKQCIYGFVTYLVINIVANWFPIVSISLMAVLWFVWILVAMSIRDEEFETS